MQSITSTAAIALLVILTATTILAQGPPPNPCTLGPPQAADFEIRFAGQRSGCTQLPGSGPCIKGEPIAFSIYTPYDAFGNCPLIYQWSFGDGGGITAKTATHIYANSGAFAVDVTVITAVNQVHPSRVVQVVDAIPTLGEIASIALVAALLALGVARLR